MRTARDRCRISEERFRRAQRYSVHGYTLSRAVRNDNKV